MDTYLQFVQLKKKKLLFFTSSLAFILNYLFIKKSQNNFLLVPLFLKYRYVTQNVSKRERNAPYNTVVTKMPCTSLPVILQQVMKLDGNLKILYPKCQVSITAYCAFVSERYNYHSEVPFISRFTFTDFIFSWLAHFKVKVDFCRTCSRCGTDP